LRRSPYQHKVSSHIRAGVEVKTYTRGEGKKPGNPHPVMRHNPGGKPGFNVSFYFPDGTETYNVRGGTLTGALREATPRIQRPVVPTHAKIRRLRA